ncbi:UNVERIFIED_CONTAM: hypothetical protein Sradi_0894100 [Sesamum radiatum]|uniref:Uncharacterized protein n=1 Tax=Sesamum radiatum TaxID=300843 RepID=A0AAW2V330_SESRA
MIFVASNHRPSNSIVVVAPHTSQQTVRNKSQSVFPSSRCTRLNQSSMLKPSYSTTHYDRLEAAYTKRAKLQRNKTWSKSSFSSKQAPHPSLTCTPRRHS